VKKLSDRDLVAREYATVDRLAMRRLDRTAWLSGEGDPWLLALAAIAEVRPTRVLDAGCGSGDFAALLTAPDVRCVDLSPAAVDAARARGLRAEVADIQNLPFPDGSFDVAVANWVLYHVHDRALAIAELARVLTSAGRFVGCYNAPGHLQELWSRVGVPVAADDFNADNGTWGVGAVIWPGAGQSGTRRGSLGDTGADADIPRRLPRDVRLAYRAGRPISLPRDQAKRRARRRSMNRPPDDHADGVIAAVNRTVWLANLSEIACW
jgi:SAM-dependent methyltransferase